MRTHPEVAEVASAVGVDAGKVGVVSAGIIDPPATAEATEVEEGTVATEAVTVALSTMVVGLTVVEGNDGKSDYSGPVRS